VKKAKVTATWSGAQDVRSGAAKRVLGRASRRSLLSCGDAWRPSRYPPLRGLSWLVGCARLVQRLRDRHKLTYLAIIDKHILYPTTVGGS
jgi:hypothetical protein